MSKQHFRKRTTKESILNIVSMQSKLIARLVSATLQEAV